MPSSAAAYLTLQMARIRQGLASDSPERERVRRNLTEPQLKASDNHQREEHAESLALVTRDPRYRWFLDLPEREPGRTTTEPAPNRIRRRVGESMFDHPWARGFKDSEPMPTVARAGKWETVQDERDEIAARIDLELRQAAELLGVGGEIARHRKADLPRLTVLGRERERILALKPAELADAARSEATPPRERLTAAVLVRVGELLDSADPDDVADATEALGLVSALAHRWRRENLGAKASMAAVRTGSLPAKANALASSLH